MADEQPSSAPEAATAPAPDTEQGEGGEGEVEQSPAQQRMTRQFVSFRKQQKAFKAEQEAFAREREKAQGEFARLQDLRGKAGENVDAWLRAAGVTDEQVERWARRRWQMQEDPSRQHYDETHAQLLARLEAQDKKLAAIENERARSQYIDKINNTIQTAPDDYELIRHYGAQQDVCELIELWREQKREELSVADACRLVEQTIEDRDEDVVKRALAARKIAKRIGWQSPGAEDDDAESQPGESDAPAPPAPRQQRDQPTRGKPKLTNASPTSSRRNATAEKPHDPYDDGWDSFREQAVRRKRR